MRLNLSTLFTTGAYTGFMVRVPSALAPLLQLGVVALSLAWLVMAPPDRGFVLLIPLWGTLHPGAVAVAEDMRIVAVGPLSSIVARSDHARRDMALLRRGIITLAAPRSWCGGG